MSIYQLPDIFDSLKTFTMTEDDYSCHQIIPQTPWNKGKTGLHKHSDKTKKRMAKAKIGKKRKPFSEETKRKMAEAKLNKPMSNEARKKMSDAAKKRCSKYTYESLHVRHLN